MTNHTTATPTVNSSAEALIQAFNDNPIVIHRIYLQLTKDYATAAALSQTLYWFKKMGRKFYKTDADFMAELCLTAQQFKRVKSNLKKLPYLSIKSEGIPAKTYYKVDYEILGKEIEKISLKATNTDSLSENTQTRPSENTQTRPSENTQTRPSENTQTNTENTQSLHRDNNNVVVVDELINKLFTNREKPTAKKLLATIPLETQNEVLCYLGHKIETNQIEKSKTGYLKILVAAALDNTFTPLNTPPNKKAPITAADQIAKEAKKAEEEAKRGKRSQLENDKRLAELQKKQTQPTPPAQKRTGILSGLNL